MSRTKRIAEEKPKKHGTLSRSTSSRQLFVLKHRNIVHFTGQKRVFVSHIVILYLALSAIVHMHICTCICIHACAEWPITLQQTVFLCSELENYWLKIFTHGLICFVAYRKEFYGDLKVCCIEKGPVQ